MTSRRTGIQIFSSLFKIVRSELAAGSTGSSGTAADAWFHLPPVAQPQQLVSLRGFSAGHQAGIVASAKKAKLSCIQEAMSDVVKSAAKRKPRAPKEAIPDVVKSAAKQKPIASKAAESGALVKKSKARSISKADATSAATEKPKRARSRRPTSTTDSTVFPMSPKARSNTASDSTSGSQQAATSESRVAGKARKSASKVAAADASSQPLDIALRPKQKSRKALSAEQSNMSTGRAGSIAGSKSNTAAPSKPSLRTSRKAATAATASSNTYQPKEGKPALKRRSRRRVQQPTEAASTAVSLTLPSYQQMKQSMPEERRQLTDEEEQAIMNHISAFQGSANVQDQALALYVNAKLFNEAVEALEDFLLASVTPELARAFVRNSPGKAAEDALFGLFAEYVVYNYSKELQAYRNRVQLVDMRRSHLWYPVARALDRKIIYHAGPTNSGKTYNALKAMKEAKTGLYCGPLRLLAMEVYDSINQEGILCNLYTGQERRELEGAKHASCTVEMINTTKHWECAVLDEIQMIGDDQRGWAWTRALQGLPANEIHLCGDASALPLVKHLCDTTGEALTVCTYDRFTELEIEPRSLPHAYSSVQAGDAIIAFSRRNIFDIKAEIERRTLHKCCVIYGALPPEMRRYQAALFNDPDSGFDVLVASDAVGMGLNLNIRRIIFHKVEKFEGKETPAPVTPSAIKQIAGRAGRRNSQYPKGLVGTHNATDLPRVIEAVNMPLSQLSTPAAGLFPEFQHLELLAGQVPNDTFGSLLERFSNEAKLEGTFFFCRQDGVMQVARLLEKVENLSLEDRFDFCMAPTQIKDNRQAAALLHFAARYASGLPVTLDINVPNVVPATAEELRHMEATHQVMSLWIWLSHRFGSNAFPGLENVMEQSEGMVKLMNQGLANMCYTNRKGGRRKAVNPQGPPKYNLQAALLQKQGPLALAYLADSKLHQKIYQTEWAEPENRKAQLAAAR